MHSISPQQAVSLASSLFAGMVMLQLSLRKKGVRWKVPSRCPSCGRSRRVDGHCDNCTTV